MLRRHSILSFAGALLAGAACATSGADNEHGPAFFGDGGGGGGADGHAAGGDAAATTHDAAAESAASDGPAQDVPPAGDGGAGADSAPEAAAQDGGGSGGDASESGASEAGSTEGGPVCASTMALLAAGGSGVAGAVWGHGQWSTASALAGGASAAPALVAYAGGYLGAFTGTGAAGDLPLESTAYTGSWSQPAHVAAALAQGIPALAVLGSSAHVVYWGSNSKFYHGTYAGSAWDSASDPVQSSGAPQSFGPSAPAAAAVGTTLLAVQSGQDGQVYAQPWSTAWQAAAPVAGSSAVTSLAPAVIALSGGGADAMIVFVHAGDAASYHLQYATRDAGTGSWSATADVYDQATNIAYAGTTPALVALPGGKALLAWQGSSTPYPYVSTYVPGTGWTAPLAATADSLVSPPSVAAGACGADAVMAYVKSGGTVQIVTSTGGAWGTPVAVAGATGMSWVAVASAP